MDGFNEEEIAERRAMLAQFAENVCPEDLEKIAKAVDLLQVMEEGARGDLSESEVVEAVRRMSREAIPNVRMSWHPMSPEYADRSFEIHPCDMTEEHLVLMDPFQADMAAILMSVASRAWFHTSGDPNEITNDKAAIVVAAASDGRVIVGLAADIERDGEVGVSSAAAAFSVRAMRAVRDNLDRAILAAETNREAMVEGGVERLVNHMTSHGMSADEANGLRAALYEADDTGLPQVVVIEDVTVTVGTDGDGGFFIEGWGRE